MKQRTGFVFLLLILCAAALAFSCPAFAAAPVARITSFKGVVAIQSQAHIARVQQVGVPLMEGDRVQTEDGEAEVTFNDGAVLRISPFSSALVQERQEESGFWIFKRTKEVRRLTALVGKLWFKSGVSKKENYLQTPTAVCGLRGSAAEFGYNNVQSLLNIVEGAGERLGLWQVGPFTNPGRAVATVNPNYQAVQTAVQQLAVARTPEAVKEAQKAVLEAAISAAKTIAENNPDPAAKVAANMLVDAATKLVEVINTTGQPIPIPTTVPPTTEPPTTAAPTTEPPTTEPPTTEPPTTEGPTTTLPTTTVPTTTKPTTTTTTTTTTTYPSPT